MSMGPGMRKHAVRMAAGISGPESGSHVQEHNLRYPCRPARVLPADLVNVYSTLLMLGWMDSPRQVLILDHHPAASLDLLWPVVAAGEAGASNWMLQNGHLPAGTLPCRYWVIAVAWSCKGMGC
jgi:hypothetical protein